MRLNHLSGYLECPGDYQAAMPTRTKMRWNLRLLRAYYTHDSKKPVAMAGI